MSEGTVTISIEEHDRLRLMDEAVSERSVIKIRLYEGYHDPGQYGKYYLVSENEATLDLVKTITGLNKEIYTLKNKLHDAEIEIRRNNDKEVFKKKWWQISI